MKFLKRVFAYIAIQVTALLLLSLVILIALPLMIPISSFITLFYDKPNVSDEEFIKQFIDMHGNIGDTMEKFIRAIFFGESQVDIQS
jgi:hypothetical protein